MTKTASLAAVIETIYQTPDKTFRWIDVTQPEAAELEGLAFDYGIPPLAIEDVMELRHLPKFERLGEVLFLILRPYDETRFKQQVEHVVDLSRKLALFIGKDFVLTIHRAPMPFFEQCKTRWINNLRRQDKKPMALLLYLVDAVIDTYQKPVDRMEEQMDRYEQRVFTQQKRPFGFKRFYKFKRELALIRKLLRLQQNVLLQLDVHLGPGPDARLQDLREAIDALTFQTDELLSDSNNLMNMYISISSHRNNEVMRVLTVFSVFFLPLTFIAGIYGMNFRIMPEIDWTYGYLFSILLMVSVTVVIYIWFRRKKWL